MTNDEFLFVIEQFNNGQINISNAEMDAFLYKKKWYPITLFVKQIHPSINNHESIKKLVTIIPYLRIKTSVNFIGSYNRPIPLTIPETIEETKLALERLNDLYIE